MIRKENCILMMHEKSIQMHFPISTLFAEDSLARAFLLLESEADLKIQEAHCSLKLQELLPLKNLNICCLKMYPDCLTTTKAGHFKKSSVHWMNWGTMSHGKCITAKISEFPSQESDCTLSAIIEKKCKAKYLLSLKQLLQILSDASEEVKVIECTPLMVHQLLSQARQEDLAEKQDFT